MPRLANSNRGTTPLLCFPFRTTRVLDGERSLLCDLETHDQSQFAFKSAAVATVCSAAQLANAQTQSVEITEAFSRPRELLGFRSQARVLRPEREVVLFTAKAVERIDLSSGEAVTLLQTPPGIGDDAGRISPSGRHFAVVSDNQHTVTVYSSDGELKGRFSTKDRFDGCELRDDYIFLRRNHPRPCEFVSHAGATLWQVPPLDAGVFVPNYRLSNSDERALYVSSSHPLRRNGKPRNVVIHRIALGSKLSNLQLPWAGGVYDVVEDRALVCELSRSTRGGSPVGRRWA